VSARETRTGTDRPNILVAIADDHAWPHTSAYGCSFVDTPAFDRIAAEGVLFDHCFCPAPSCTPSRAALLTGRNPWQLGEGVNLWSTLPAHYAVYPDILDAAGYHVGLTNKGWAPGSVEAGGRTRNPAGPGYNEKKNIPPTPAMSSNDYSANFRDFLDAKPANAPFCFWYGAKEPHRGYDPGSGLRSGKRLEDVQVPPFLPDTEEIRNDLLDYALEIEWFDTHLGRMIELLESRGELENTIIVVTGDNGMPFPKAKANLYEIGMHVPLALRWGAGAVGARRVSDFVSFIDLAPTFLEAAGIETGERMTGKSLLRLLGSDRSGRVESERDHVVTGRERHAFCRPGNTGYPMRALRTDDYLYIRNFAPDRRPAGDPPSFGDIDGSPTKHYLMAHRDEPAVRPYFDRAFGNRGAEELYAVADGYACDRNLIADPASASTLDALRHRLESILTAQGDPRMLDPSASATIDGYRYYGNTTDRDGRTAFTGTDALRRAGLLD
jgi:N-sulfoglucosamine sulfohydrolase